MNFNYLNKLNMKENNLVPFKPGKDVRRNIEGRPKKMPAIDQLLAEVLAEPGNNGIETAKQILLALVAKALKGDTKAAELLLDRAYGKARQSIEHSGDVGIIWNEVKTYDVGDVNAL